MLIVDAVFVAVVVSAVPVDILLGLPEIVIVPVAKEAFEGVAAKSSSSHKSKKCQLISKRMASELLRIH